MEFTLNGERRSLNRDDVLLKLKGVEPEVPRQHVVEIDRRLFPVKQAFAVASGLDRLDFTSAQARSVLQRLGFKLFRL